VTPTSRGTPSSPRAEGLQRVQQWFAPAFAPDETLRAALAATPFPVTYWNSIVAAGKELTGHNQGRVLLLSDETIHVVGRHFWRRRFRAELASYAVGTVPVRYAADVLHIADVPFYLNAAGFQMGGVVGSNTDVELFVAAGS
jgi:hypothetical protein